jgi:hypothetical protein
MNGNQLIKTWVPIQFINIPIDYPNLMFNIKIIFLKNEILIKLHETFQWLIIKYQGECATKK